MWVLFIWFPPTALKVLPLIWTPDDTWNTDMLRDKCWIFLLVSDKLVNRRAIALPWQKFRVWLSFAGQWWQQIWLRTLGYKINPVFGLCERRSFEGGQKMRARGRTIWSAHGRHQWMRHVPGCQIRNLWLDLHARRWVRFITPPCIPHLYELISHASKSSSSRLGLPTFTPQID